MSDSACFRRPVAGTINRGKFEVFRFLVVQVLYEADHPGSSFVEPVHTVDFINGTL